MAEITDDEMIAALKVASEQLAQVLLANDPVAQLRQQLENSGKINLAQRAELADVYRRAERAEAALTAIPRWAIKEALSYQSLAHMYWHKELKSWLATLPQPAAQKSCAWTETDGGEGWATACGELHVILAGTPPENGYRYCCYCGQPLVAQPWTDPQPDFLPARGAAPWASEQMPEAIES